MEEIQIIYELLKSESTPLLMVDVGAHHGSSLSNFAKDGWKVYAFEPDDTNREILQNTTRNFSSVVIDDRAVSNQENQQVQFYSSKVSSGISSLSSFHSSHVKSNKVSTITLSTYLSEKNTYDVTFLKIDAEGHDLFVLEGYPWDKSKPKVVLCEFEDNKTNLLGYDFHKMAEFLVNKGYFLLVSEWYPVKQYGTTHHWRVFKEYPCELADANSWGNIIAVSTADMFKNMKALAGYFAEHYKNNGLLSYAIENSNRELSLYKNKHVGERCVIIGNGPSLNKMDLSFLKDEITFGLNKIYLLREQWGFDPTYFVSVNPLVIEQNIDDILKVPAPKFISHNGIPYVDNVDDVIFLQSVGEPHFSADVRNGLWEGYTVTFVAMQLAYYMGFKEVMLIGVDHYFKSSGPANAEVTSEGSDENHFHPDYFGKGVRWHLPDLDNSEVAYQMAKQAYELDGRRIVDATLDGHLQVFDKANYIDLLQQYHEEDGKNWRVSIKARTMNEFAIQEYKCKKVDMAISVLNDAIKLAPAYIESYVNLMVINWDEGNIKEALSFLAKGLHIKPNDKNLITNGAEILNLLEKPNDAIALYQNYLEANPEDVDILTRINEIQKN